MEVSDDAAYVSSVSSWCTLAVLFSRAVLRAVYGDARDAIRWVASYARVHNVLLAAGSAVAFVVLTVRAYADGRYSSLEAFACRPNGPTSTDGIIYMLYLSKMVEFLDTLIMIAAKKRVHWMHRLHHLSTMGLVWHCMESGNRGEILAAGTSLVSHVLLYGYYAFPIKALRPLINVVQVAQFSICLCAAAALMAIRFARPATACSGSFLAELHGIIAFSIYLFLMGRYLQAVPR